jgi:hypothetical protein
MHEKAIINHNKLAEYHEYLRKRSYERFNSITKIKDHLSDSENLKISVSQQASLTKEIKLKSCSNENLQNKIYSKSEDNKQSQIEKLGSVADSVNSEEPKQSKRTRLTNIFEDSLKIIKNIKSMNREEICDGLFRNKIVSILSNYFITSKKNQ